MSSNNYNLDRRDIEGVIKNAKKQEQEIIEKAAILKSFIADKITPVSDGRVIYYKDLIKIIKEAKNG